MPADVLPALERYISQQELLTLIPFTRQHVARLEAAGRFPKRIQLGDRKIAWKLSAVRAWLDEREALADDEHLAASARGKAVRAARKT
jgi:prophage regulatory protein